MIDGLLALLAGAFRTDSAVEPLPAPLPESLHGVALFPGKIFGGTRYGVTFVGVHDGACWGATMNYQPPEAHGGVTNTIVGGHWHFTSIAGGASRGALLGSVILGQIVRSEDGLSGEITALVLVRRGVRAYRGATGMHLLIQGRAEHTPPWPVFRGTIQAASATGCLENFASTGLLQLQTKP